MTTSTSSTVSGVLQSTHQRRAVCTKRLSNEQLILHGRGAQTLRNTSLFDATIPFGFTPISSTSADTPTPSTSSVAPSSHGPPSSPFAPLMIQSNAKESDGESFVFARRGDASTTQAVVSSPPAAILNVFLPLSMPPHLSPRSTPGSETTWTDATPRRPTLSRSLPSEPWVGSAYLEGIPDEEEEEKHLDPTPAPRPRKPQTKRPKMRRAITNENCVSLSAFFS
jgi:hypothetical protein